MAHRLGRPIGIAVLLGSFVLLLGAANAAAAVRFAAPGGPAPASSSCELANPCSLFNAASREAPGTHLAANDEVVVEPGEYSNTGGDLGPLNLLHLREDISLHGVAGQPRPTIVATLGNFSGLIVESGDSVSHLQLQTHENVGIAVQGGVVDDVIVRNTAEGGFACRQSAGIIRDSVCLSDAPLGKAVGDSNGTSSTLTLRSVTAIATGPGSTGLFARAFAGSRVTTDAKAVIVEGTAHDVFANAEGTGSVSSITLENSDFDTSEAVSMNNGTASVTAPGAPTNIIAPPLLAADGFHELAASPTIDAGATDASSGTADIDGQSRKIGPETDIGADEKAPAAVTATTIACTPSSARFGGATTCTATVENSPAGGTAPGGGVEFSTGQVGSFTDAGTPSRTCSLVDEGGGKAACHLTYTPIAIVGSHKITASYAGDIDHEPSLETTQLSVSQRPTAATVVCAPTAPAVLEAATCTATVEETSGSVSSDFGGVVHFAGDQPGSFTSAGTAANSCKPPERAGSRVSCTLDYTPTVAGAHKITASYEGDGNHESSGPASTRLTVSARPTATTIVCAPANLLLGAAADCTATVSDTSSIPTAPTGLVGFSSDGQGAFAAAGACTLAPTGNGKASCQLAYTPSAVGSAHTITAAYRGDGIHGTSHGSAQVQVGAPVPNTTLKKKPARKTSIHRARFTFASDEAGKTFQCKLDQKPFKPCRSPFDATVKPGRHSFSVRAVNIAGMPDPTPAVFHWKVS
jgi:hypothetical protein